MSSQAFARIGSVTNIDGAVAVAATGTAAGAEREDDAGGARNLPRQGLTAAAEGVGKGLGGAMM